MRISGMLIAALALAGCVGEAGDGRDDSFMTAEETASLDAQQQQAILALANVATEEELMGEAGFGALPSGPDAIRSIMEFRAGPDGLPDTSDDQLIDSLATLDAIPWVGPNAIGLLLGWAFSPSYDAGYGLPFFLSHSATLSDVSAVKTDSFVLGGLARPVLTTLDVFVYGRNPDAVVVDVVFYDEYRVAQLRARNFAAPDGTFLIQAASEVAGPPVYTTCGWGICAVQNIGLRSFQVAGAITAPSQIVISSYSAAGVNGARYVELTRNPFFVSGYWFSVLPQTIEYHNTLPLTGVLWYRGFGWTPGIGFTL